MHPAAGDIHVVTKEKKGPAGAHRIKPAFGGGEVQRAGKVADISVPPSPEGPITGRPLSPNGRRPMLCNAKSGYEFVLPADTNAATRTRPDPKAETHPRGRPPSGPQGEGFP